MVSTRKPCHAETCAHVIVGWGFSGERRERGAPGISIAPVHSDILHYGDDLGYQAPHQSRTFHALRNIIEYEGNVMSWVV